MRKYYLDNIRWITVLLVLVYHVFYLFNGVGVQGGVGGFSDFQYQDALLYFVYPWFMVLLFVISGISSKYALDKKTDKQFVKDRTLKLLVPSTLGLVAFQWIGGYYNITIGGGWKYIPSFLRYPVMVASGTGPLWFIQLLWLFSLLLVLIRKLDKQGKLLKLGGSCNIIAICLLFIPIWGASQILNVPVIKTYRFGIYPLAFLLGYFVFSHDEIQDKVEKIHVPALIIAIACGIAYTWYYFGTDYSDQSCSGSLFTNAYLWIAVIAVLGCGKAWLNKTSAFAQYMTRSSFGIYIVHYVVVLIACYYLKASATIPAAVCYCAAIAAVLLLSPLLYEIIKRIPVLRFCVLGIKKPKKAASVDAG